jgi:hypothetical protein
MYGALIPAAIVILLLLVSATFNGAKPSIRTREAWGSIAAGAGFLAGFAGILGLPGFPPHDSTQGLFYGIAVSSAAGAGLVFATAMWAWLMRAVAAAAVLAFAARAPIVNLWSIAESAFWLTAFVAGTLAAWGAVEAHSRRAPGLSPAIQLFLIATAAAVVLVTSGSAKLGQLAGALAACAAGLGVYSLRRREIGPIRGALAVFVIGAAALSLQGRFLAEAPTLSVVFLLLAALCGWASEFPPLRKRSGTIATASVLCATLTCSAAAILVSLWNASQTPDYGY